VQAEKPKEPQGYSRQKTVPPGIIKKLAALQLEDDQIETVSASLFSLLCID
jgi:hypothetical protein